MKRVVLPIIALLVVASAGALFYRIAKPAARQTAELLPANTLFYADVPDIRRTAQRWPQTELAQIFAEPEVQAFLQRPMASIPDHADFTQFTDSLQKIEPAHFFFAAMSGSSSLVPPVVIGLQYTGSRDELDQWIGKLRTEAEETWPGAKPSVEKYGTGDIETLTAPSFSAGVAYRGNWVFLATDTTLLKFVLDHLDNPADSQSLAELPSFKTALGQMPADADSFMFIRPALMADKVAALELMANPMADSQPDLGSLKKDDAISAALKFDGPLMRDYEYAVVASATAQPPLALDVLKASTHDSILAADYRVDGSISPVQFPDAKADPTGIFALLHSYTDMFAAQGLGLDQFAHAFGPETGIVVDWPSGAIIPAPFLVMDVRDHALAQKFLDTLATIQIGAGLDFTRQDSGGISWYTLPPNGFGFFSVQATIGLTPKTVFASLNSDPIKAAAARWDSNTQGLDTTDAYKQAVDLVGKPTNGFQYLDTKSAFSRVYGLLKSVASMGLLGDYIDQSKLPAEETITKHLSPIVGSVSVLNGGTRFESAGTITVTQGSGVLGAAVGAATVVVMERQLKGQGVAIPGFPFFNSGGSGQGNPGGQTPPTNPLPTTNSAPPPVDGSPSPSASPAAP